MLRAARARLAEPSTWAGIRVCLTLNPPETPAMPAATPLRRHGGMSDAERQVRKCWIPCDHIPARSWALFKARDTLRGVIESLRQEARA